MVQKLERVEFVAGNLFGGGGVEAAYPRQRKLGGKIVFQRDANLMPHVALADGAEQGHVKLGEVVVGVGDGGETAV